MRRASLAGTSTSGRCFPREALTRRHRAVRVRGGRGPVAFPRLRATAGDEVTAGLEPSVVPENQPPGLAVEDPFPSPPDANDTSARLWSNVAPDDSGALAREPGSLPGAIALVAGTTVGAGMLALPTVCQSSGFVPSTTALVLCWGYMLGTGLLVLEVNLDVMRQTGNTNASIVTMADRTLGANGVRFAWAAYVFIHYALLVAYLSRVGQLLAQTTRDFLGVDGVSDGAAATAYAATFGLVIFASSPRRLDKINAFLVALVLATFAPLLALGAANVNVQNFQTGDWQAVGPTIPVIALAFVFHNVVPVVATQLEGDAAKAKLALGAGTAIPFAMFALWDAALLGSVSQAQAEDALDAVARSGGAIEAIADPLAALQATSPAATALVAGFSFFAITTSFLGFVLGLVDFLTDGLGFDATRRAKTDVSNGTSSKFETGNDWRPFALTLVPPWAFALSYPDVFLDALDTAGTFGVLTLFGCMPPAMAWSNRYGGFGNDETKAVSVPGDGGDGGSVKSKESESNEPSGALVPGGKPALIACFGLAAGVVVTESVQRVGYLLFDR